MSRKNIIIISIATIFLISTSIFFIKNNRLNVFNDADNEEIFIPEFLSSVEKQSLGIPEENNIQVVTRDDNGEVLVYRVIESDDQVINPGDVESVSPRTMESE